MYNLLHTNLIRMCSYFKRRPVELARIPNTRMTISPMDDDEYYPSQIENNLYLGGVSYIKDDFFDNIDSIVSLIEPGQLQMFAKNYDIEKKNHLHISISDNMSADILSHLNSIIEFIERELLQGKTVYVHCAAGISRSSTCVIAYMMKRYNMTTTDAYAHVKQKRRIISPNMHFMASLYIFEKWLKSDKLIPANELAKVICTSG